MFFISFTINKKRPNLQNIANFFVAGQLRSVAMMLTGQEIISMFIFGYYLVKKNEVRISSLVGSLATIHVLRAIITIAIGLPFMITGQVYISNVMSFVGGQNVNM